MELRPGDPIATLDGGDTVTVREVLGHHPTREEADRAALVAAAEPTRDAAVVEDGDRFAVVITEEISTLRHAHAPARPLEAVSPRLLALASGTEETGVSLRARVPGTDRLNEVLRTSDSESPPGGPSEVAAAELALVAQDAIAFHHGEVERAMHAVDAGATQLASGNPDVAAEVYRQEAERIRSFLPEVEPLVDRTVLERVAESLERRAQLYGVEGSREARAAASSVYYGARNAMFVADGLAEDYPEHAEVLRAIGSDSMLQATAVLEHAVQTDAAYARSMTQIYQEIVDTSFQLRFEGSSDIGNFFTGDKDELEADRARMGDAFGYLNHLIDTQGIPLHEAWHRMFNDAQIGNDALRNFPTPRQAAMFLRDHPVSAGLLSPMTDLSRGMWEGEVERIDQGRARLVEALRENDQWAIASSVLDDFEASAASRIGKAEAARLRANQSSERWMARGEDFAEELPLLLLSGLVSGGAGWGVRALTYGSRMNAAARTAAVVGTELSTFVVAERILSETVAGRDRDWSPAALGRDLAIGAAGYGIFRGLGAGWQAFRARAPNLGRFGRLAQSNRAATQATIDATEETLNVLQRTVIELPRIVGPNRRHLTRLGQQAHALNGEIVQARRLLAQNPSGASRAQLERALSEARPVIEKLERYSALRRPSLPTGRAATADEIAEHAQALERYTAVEVQLRRELTEELALRAEALYRVQAELAGIRTRPLAQDAGAPFRTDPLLRARQFRAEHPQLTPRQNIGMGELTVGPQTRGIGPAGSGGGGGQPFNLERTGRYAAEARTLTPQPGRHGFSRANDSEVQILEQAAVMLRADPRASGTLRLFTERPPCISCRRVMTRFMADHPNITIEVFYLGYRVPASVGIGAGTVGDRTVEGL
ncbi:MAG: deaminase domain-containing protein [Myxococcota bacterium]